LGESVEYRDPTREEEYQEGNLSRNVWILKDQIVLEIFPPAFFGFHLCQCTPYRLKGDIPSCTRACRPEQIEAFFAHLQPPGEQDMIRVLQIQYRKEENICTGVDLFPVVVNMGKFISPVVLISRDLSRGTRWRRSFSPDVTACHSHLPLSSGGPDRIPPPPLSTYMLDNQIFFSLTP